MVGDDGGRPGSAPGFILNPRSSAEMVLVALAEAILLADSILYARRRPSYPGALIHTHMPLEPYEDVRSWVPGSIPFSHSSGSPGGVLYPGLLVWPPGRSMTSVSPTSPVTRPTWCHDPSFRERTPCSRPLARAASASTSARTRGGDSRKMHPKREALVSKEKSAVALSRSEVGTEEVCCEHTLGKDIA